MLDLDKGEQQTAPEEAVDQHASDRPMPVGASTWADAQHSADYERRTGSTTRQTSPDYSRLEM